MVRSILHIILIIIVALIQLSLAKFGKLDQLNLILTLIIFTAVLVGSRTFWWAFFGGIVLDLYSISPFGLATFILLLVTYLAIFLARRVMTNRSLTSLLAIGFLAILAYDILYFVSSQLLFLLKLAPFRPVLSRFYLLSTSGQILVNLCFLAVVFLGAKLTSRKLKNLFIFREKSFEL